MATSTELQNLRQWNTRLGQHFFREQMAGQEVFLFVTNRLLEEIGADLGGKAGFLRAVQARKPPYQNWSLCRFAAKQHENWRSNPLGIDYPPYLAYLALFVLAATDQDQELSVNSYYPHLARLLNSPNPGTPSGFKDMDVLWQDVSWWANERQQERRGRFTFRRRGHLAHVGLPLAQTLLSREERDSLPRVFEAADLYPGEQAPENRLAQVLLRHGAPWLQARTRRLLACPALPATAEGTLRVALLEIVQEELTNWDGLVPDPDPTQSAGMAAPAPLRAGLRLCVRDQGLGRLAVRLRFRATRELPDTALQLGQGAVQLSCYGLPGGAGWTSELATANGQPYDATAHDWQRPLALHDAEQGYAARLRGGPVRLLLPAERQGLPKGWLEAETLTDDGPFRLLVHDSAWAKVRVWGEAHCGQFRVVAGATVPAGWQWVEGRQPRQSCPEVSALTLPTRTTARLVGGLRAEGRSNEFFRFALPELLLSGISTDVSGYVNDQPLARLAGSANGFALPVDLPVDLTHWLEVRQGDQVLLRRAVRVSDGHRAPNTAATAAVGRGPTGQAAAAPAPRAMGALLHCATAHEGVPFPRPLPTHLARTLILLGECPGQVAEWPAEPVPTTWQPVWAVGKLGRDHWQPFFCGTDAQLQAGRPGPALAGGQGRKAWGKATHGQRRHTNPPKLKVLAQLWKTYQDAGQRL